MRVTARLWKMAKDTVLEGVFAINKPLGMSSAQVIRDCQQHFNPSTLFAPLVQQEISKRLNESGSQFKRRGINKKGARVKMGHGGTASPRAAEAQAESPQKVNETVQDDESEWDGIKD
ncbi:hypothetical protein BN1708_005603 [Verticillium longisporum]|uniref:Uncharacterized protein n=1 Tax=Verticillium longisporum TaxID=100787 RepID=A0A0G4MDD7_VERLO|nr:hypothetical protein BN1708_005603 [Verticillium longisporum]